MILMELSNMDGGGVLIRGKEDEVLYTLMGKQAESWQYLVDFCVGKVPQRKAILIGYAGTGKSFTINRVVEAVRKQEPRINFGMTAPTHKAVRVLKKFSELRDALDFGTIHSFLGLKETLVENPIGSNKWEVVYKPDFNPNQRRKIDGIDILVVDESSMLSDELFEHIENEMRSNEYLRVIYMGDAKQIPPVGKKQKTGESMAIPFMPARQTSHRIHVLELTEPQRQAKESPIIMYATAIREQHLQQAINFEFKDEYKEALEAIPHQVGLGVLREVFRKYFMTPEFEADQDYVKIVAWRNDTVNYFNREIRLLINNATILPKIILGEKLIMDKPLIETTGSKKSIILSNNEEIQVTQVEPAEFTLKYKLLNNKTAFDRAADGTDSDSKVSKEMKVKVYKVKLTTPEEFTTDAIIIHEESEKEFEELRTTLKNAAIKTRDRFDQKDMWRQFYSIGEHFAWVKYNYCLTAHKAQGSTYDYVISMEWDICENTDIEERNRIRYVAVTRARHKAFIIK